MPAFVAEPQLRDPATAREALHPSNAFPREVAGAAVVADIVKCRTKPLDPADCPVAFDATQWQGLRAAFPQGVCDRSRPGVQQRPIAGTWQSF